MKNKINKINKIKKSKKLNWKINQRIYDEKFFKIIFVNLNFTF